MCKFTALKNYFFRDVRFVRPAVFRFSTDLTLHRFTVLTPDIDRFASEMVHVVEKIIFLPVQKNEGSACERRNCPFMNFKIEKNYI